MSDWRHEAACINDPIPFDDPEPVDRGPARLRREAQAVAVCLEKCHVRDECLEDALIHETTAMAFNIRGGKTPDQRKNLIRQRQRRRKKEMALRE